MASYVIVGMIGVLLLGFWKLQVIDSDKYATLAERNRVREIPVIAPRGRMLDRDGRVLVDNRPSFSVLLLRDDMSLVEKHLGAISDGLGIPMADLRDQLNSTKNLAKFQPIVIKSDASPADIAFIESHKSDIPVLEMISVSRRRYLPGGFLSHAVGYVGEVSEQQIEASNGKLRPGDFAGKFGLEQQYNDVLQGTDGKRRVIVNSVGKEVSHLPTQEAIPGKQIQLSIDYDLQQVAEQSLGDRPGAIVALDPRNGEVLAMASHPTLDPNDFAVRVSTENWKKLNEDPHKPLLNRAIQAQLAPGSVFKIVTATAMLEDHVPPQSFTTFCPGYANFFGRQYHCWVYYAKKGPKSHGVTNLHEAILQSCDVFFYNVGLRLGIDRLAYYGSHFGIGHKTGIDLPGEETGLMPSPEWVERALHRKWYQGEVISVATGQGAVTTTPLQLARMIGGIASGGVFMQPHMLKDAPNVKDERFPISEHTIEEITDAMYGVVNEPHGTAGDWLRHSRTRRQTEKVRRQCMVRRLRAAPQSGDCCLRAGPGKRKARWRSGWPRRARRHQGVLRQEEQEDARTIHGRNKAACAPNQTYFREGDCAPRSPQTGVPGLSCHHSARGRTRALSTHAFQTHKSQMHGSSGCNRGQSFLGL